MKLEKQEIQEIQEYECDKVSYVWLWAILFLIALFIAMVEW